MIKNNLLVIGRNAIRPLSFVALAAIVFLTGCAGTGGGSGSTTTTTTQTDRTKSSMYAR